MCQIVCETFSECHFFYFDDGECKLYSGDTRSECLLIGGSPEQSLVDCLIDTDTGCDAFTQLHCQYQGQEYGLSPPDGQIKSAEECEEEQGKVHQGITSLEWNACNHGDDGHREEDDGGVG